MKSINTTAQCDPRRPAARGIAVAVVCLLVAGCGARDTYEEYDDKFERAIGQLLGERVAAESPGEGRVVVVLRRGGDEFQPLRNEAFLAGLNAGLSSGIYFLHDVGPDLSVVQPEYQDAVAQALNQGWPPRAFLNWCRVDPRAVAVVSFVEFPPGIRASALSRLPPLFIFSTTTGEEVRRLASEGAFRVAIVPRPGDENAGGPSRKAPAAEIVAARYDVVVN